MRRRQLAAARAARFAVAAAVLSVLVLPAPARAGSGAEALYGRAKAMYRSLEASPRRQKYRDQWERVIRAFVRVADRYPSLSRADDALYNAS